jgi:hypothetical protein
MMSIGEIMRDPVLAPLAVLMLVFAMWGLREASAMRPHIRPHYHGSPREKSDRERERDPPDDALSAQGQTHKRRSRIALTLMFVTLGTLLVIANGR